MPLTHLLVGGGIKMSIDDTEKYGENMHTYVVPVSSVNAE